MGIFQDWAAAHPGWLGIIARQAGDDIDKARALAALPQAVATGQVSYPDAVKMYMGAVLRLGTGAIPAVGKQVGIDTVGTVMGRLANPAAGPDQALVAGAYRGGGPAAAFDAATHTRNDIINKIANLEGFGLDPTNLAMLLPGPGEGAAAGRLGPALEGLGAALDPIGTGLGLGTTNVAPKVAGLLKSGTRHSGDVIPPDEAIRALREGEGPIDAAFRENAPPTPPGAPGGVATLATSPRSRRAPSALPGGAQALLGPGVERSDRVAMNTGPYTAEEAQRILDSPLMRQIKAKYGDQFNPEEALRINADLEQAAAETGRTTRVRNVPPKPPAGTADFAKPGALPPGEDYVPGLRTPYLYQGAQSYLAGLENQAAKLRKAGPQKAFDLRGVEHEIGIVRDYLGLPPVEAPEAALAKATPEPYQQGALDLSATTPTSKPPPEGQLPGENAAPPATPPAGPQRTFGQVYQEWRTSPPGAQKDALLEEFVTNRQSLIDRGGKVPIPPDMQNALDRKASQEAFAADGRRRGDVPGERWRALREAALGRNVGLLPGAAQVPTAAITGLGGAIVGAAGAEQQTGGQATPGDLLKGAASGAAIGALGAKVPYGDLAGQIAVGHGEGKRLMGEALQNGRFTRSNLFRDWKENIVNTVPGGRQMFLDKIEGMVKAVASDIPLSEVAKTRKDLIARSRAQGGVAEMDRATEQFLADLGVNPANFDWKQAIGQGFFGGHLTGEQMLHPAQSAATGAATSLATGAAFGVPLLGAALGAARGAIRPYTTGAAHAISDIDQHAFRNTAFRKSAGGMIADAGDAFLAQLKRAGVNTAALDGRAGRFSPAEVAQVVGGQQGMQAATVWHGIVAQVVGAPALQKGQQQVDGLATKFVKDTFGDFSSDPGRAQTWLGRVAPFSRYVMSQMPVVARMVRDHPGAALLVGNLLARQYGNLKDNGEPAYLVGSVPLPDNPVAQAALGGQPGQTRLPLLQVVSPLSGNSASAIDQLGQADPSSAQGIYQAVTGVLGLLGLSPNPLIDTAAYLMGGNPQAPGPQSRTSGLEQALPGPVVPTVKGLLDNATKALGNQPDTYDPVQMAAREIYFREHGVPISQAPKADQKQLLDPNSTLMKEARDAVTSGGAVKNAISILSPATLSTETAVKQQYRQAKAGTQLPYTPAQIQAATKVAPDVAVQMQRANDAAQAQAPATQVYKNPKLTARDKQDPRLTAWERQHAALAHTAPNVYKQLRSEFIRVAGIKTNN